MSKFLREVTHEIKSKETKPHWQINSLAFPFPQALCELSRARDDHLFVIFESGATECPIPGLASGMVDNWISLSNEGCYPFRWDSIIPDCILRSVVNVWLSEWGTKNLQGPLGSPLVPNTAWTASTLRIDSSFGPTKSVTSSFSDVMKRVLDHWPMRTTSPYFAWRSW